VRARGLKRFLDNVLDVTEYVAPRAGAWIETFSGDFYDRASVEVAPRAGAWIETWIHPVMDRVLAVAPRAGAWIETSSVTDVTWTNATSRPVRARGLKHQVFERCHALSPSRPVRARGLKPPGCPLPNLAHASRPVRARGLKL